MKKIDNIFGYYFKSLKDFNDSKKHSAFLMEDLISGWVDYLESSIDELVFSNDYNRQVPYNDYDLKDVIELTDDGYWFVRVGINVLNPQTGKRSFTVFTRFFIKEEKDQYMVKLGTNGKPFEVEAINKRDLSGFYEHAYSKCAKKTYDHVQNVKGEVSKERNNSVFIN